MGGFALAALGIAAGTSLLSGFAQADADKRVAEFNARQAEREAAAAEAESKEEASRIRREGRRLRGKQISQAAASGLGLSGSVLDILADDAMEVELQALDTIRQGKMSGIKGREEAQVSRFTGSARATSSILGGISRAAGLGFKAHQSGLLNFGNEEG